MALRFSEPLKPCSPRKQCHGPPQLLTAPVPRPILAPLLDNSTPGQSRGRKATGPRFLRDAVWLTPRRTHDRRATERCAWRFAFWYGQVHPGRPARASSGAERGVAHRLTEAANHVRAYPATTDGRPDSGHT